MKLLCRIHRLNQLTESRLNWLYKSLQFHISSCMPEIIEIPVELTYFQLPEAVKECLQFFRTYAVTRA